MSQTVLILGASGKIGSWSSKVFKQAGWTVRHYNRAQNDMTAAAEGVDVIANGLKPPNYHNWGELIPQITEQVIAAASQTKATVILPGNIYVYGNQPGVLSENTPHTPNSRKRQTREDMERAYKAAGIQTIILRAGNFIDPDGNGDILGLMFMRDFAKGRLTTPSDPSTLQAYAYVPDWARAAVALAEKQDTLAKFEDIPFPGHAFALEQLKQALEAETGQALKVQKFPWGMMTLLSPFWELARELREMRYLYEMPHSLSADRFETLLPDFEATPLSKVLLSGLPR